MELLIEKAQSIILALDNDKSGWPVVYDLLGLWYPSGKPNRRAQDYSRRISIRVANYDECDGEKDIGEMSRSAARSVLGSAIPATKMKWRV
jgi:hypothetical protein